MKKPIKIVIVIVAIAIIGGAGFFVYKATHLPSGTQPIATQVAKAMYACPMNCVPPTDKPGQSCAKCGMAMVLQK